MQDAPPKPNQGSNVLFGRKVTHRSLLSPPPSSPIQPYDSPYAAPSCPGSSRTRHSKLFHRRGGTSGNETQSPSIPQHSQVRHVREDTHPKSSNLTVSQNPSCTEETRSTPAPTDSSGDGDQKLDGSQDSNCSTRTSLLEAIIAADGDSFNVSMDDLMASFSFSLDQPPLSPSSQPEEALEEPVQMEHETDMDENHVAPVDNSQSGQSQLQMQAPNQASPPRRRRLIVSDEADDDDWVCVEEDQQHSSPQDHSQIYAIETPVEIINRQTHSTAVEDVAREDEEEQYRSQASSFADNELSLSAQYAQYPPGQRINSATPLSEASTSHVSFKDDLQTSERQEDERTLPPAATVGSATFDSIESYFHGHDSIFHSQEHTQEFQQTQPMVGTGSQGDTAAILTLATSDLDQEQSDTEPMFKRQKANTERYIRRVTATESVSDEEGRAEALDMSPVATTSDVVATANNNATTAAAPRATSYVGGSNAAPSLSHSPSTHMFPVKNPILTADLIAAPRPTSPSPNPPTSPLTDARINRSDAANTLPARPAMATGTTTSHTSPRPKRVHVPLVFEEGSPSTRLLVSAPATRSIAPSENNNHGSTSHHSHHQNTAAATVEQMNELSEVNRNFAHRPWVASHAAAQEERYSLTQTTFYKQRQPGYIPVPSFRPRYQRSRRKKTTRERTDTPRGGAKFSPLVAQPVLTDDSDVHLSDILFSQPLSVQQGDETPYQHHQQHQSQQ
ncbi:hypothetical protein BGW41_006372 [Actinomortierella wolfii]|nr:hypothetical protein BGW41_006372 [Actinomortierella wolfii]